MFGMRLLPLAPGSQNLKDGASCGAATLERCSSTGRNPEVQGDLGGRYVGVMIGSISGTKKEAGHS